MRHLVLLPPSLHWNIKCGCNPVRPQTVTEFFHKESLHAHQCRSLTGIVVDTQARPLSGIVRIRIYRSRSSLVTCRTPIFTDSERVSWTEYRNGGGNFSAAATRSFPNIFATIIYLQLENKIFAFSIALTCNRKNWCDNVFEELLWVSEIIRNIKILSFNKVICKDLFINKISIQIAHHEMNITIDFIFNRIACSERIIHGSYLRRHWTLRSIWSNQEPRSIACYRS